jgi:hypothetical protein
MTDCVFRFSDQKLTRVSGADAGTYKIVDNFANILISGVTSRVCPFDRRIAKNNADGTITISIT